MLERPTHRDKVKNCSDNYFGFKVSQNHIIQSGTFPKKGAIEQPIDWKLKQHSFTINIGQGGCWDLIETLFFHFFSLPHFIFSSSKPSGGRYPGFLIEWIFYWIESSQIKNFESIYELNFPGKKLIEYFFELNIPEKMILNNPLNWILLQNEWMNHILNQYLPFLMKSPLFCLFLTLFGTFPIRPVSMIPWLLNWIIFWIESADFFELNDILNWILGKAILNPILN